MTSKTGIKLGHLEFEETQEPPFCSSAGWGGCEQPGLKWEVGTETVGKAESREGKELRNKFTSSWGGRRRGLRHCFYQIIRGQF